MTEIIFVDARVENHHALIQAIETDAETVVLDARRDGLEEMRKYLDARGGIDAIHVISHGGPGTLYLGSAVLNEESIDEHADDLRAIGRSLGGTGDLLLYGCNVALGEEGLSFVEKLSALTGAEVAASTNVIGAAARGGRCALDVATGFIEARPAVSAQSLEAWGGVLANTAPHFGVTGDGKVTTDFSGSEDVGESVTLQPDGRILVGGSSSGGDFALVRYNADGSLDSSFHRDGKVTTDADGWGLSIALQPDGKILVAGANGLVRYTADGSLDTTFDGDGMVTTDSESSFFGRSVTVQPDLKILVAGSSFNDSDVSFDFALVRYNPDGSLDTSFDSDGKVDTDLGGFIDEGHSVTLQPDGKILVAGIRFDTDIDFALVRYNADGSLDTGFDGDGKVTTDFSGSRDLGESVTLQPDGRILVGGESGEDFALVRYNADGSLDTTFDSDGKVTTDIAASGDWGRSVMLQPDGKILLAGGNLSSGDFALVRYNADGSLDTTFDGDGKVTTDFRTESDSGLSVTLQPDGKIVIAGISWNGSNNDFALARYNPDGSLDTSFNVHALNGAPTYVQNLAPVVLDSDVQVLDAELAAQGHYAGASLTLARHGGASAQDVFSAAGELGALTEGSALVYSGVIVGTVTTNSGGTLGLTFNSDATQERVNGVLESIAYSNASDTPPASVQINWTFSDGNTGAQGTGGTLAALGSTTVTIAPVILWSSLVDGQVIEFDPQHDGLFFDDAAIAAAAVDVTSGSAIFSHGGKTVTVLMDLGSITTANVGFDDGSLLLVGGNTTGTANDAGSNTLTAAGGNDHLLGLGGNDLLVGGAGADRIDGGIGFDTAMYTTATAGLTASLLGPHTNTGDAEGDSYVSIEGLVGTNFRDTLFGDGNFNGIHGRGGDDSLYGLGGGNIIRGGDGNDYLYSGAGADLLDGGAGIDFARYDSASAAVTADLDGTVANAGEALNDSYMLVEGLIGSDFADRLYGNAGANDLQGRNGNDLIHGRAGDDALDGGNGTDVLDGGTGHDALYGSDGSDTLRGGDDNDRLYGGADGDVLNGGAGFDYARYDSAMSPGVTADLSGSVAGTGEAQGDSFILIEGLVGSAFADQLVGDGNANDLQGRGGDDSIYGGAGNDTVQGGNGDDNLYGGAGADELHGGAGFDYARYDFATASVTVDLGSMVAHQGEAIGDTFLQIEGVVGSAFGDHVYGDGNANNLQGRNGNDVVDGRGGNDTLNGGAGVDQLTGGTGNDSFVFQRGNANGDSVIDFDGNGAAAGDRFIFQGYGTAPGATFMQLDATHWKITSSDGLVQETITLTNAAPVASSDYTFI